MPVIAKEAGLTEIYGICLAENKASRAVMDKCGFKNIYRGRPVPGRESRNRSECLKILRNPNIRHNYN